MLREKAVIGDAVSRRDFVVVVAEQRSGDLLFLRPCFLGEGIVAADAEDDGVEAGVIGESLRNRAQFLGADARECHRHEEQNDVGLAGILGQRHKFDAVGMFAGEREVGSFGSFGEHGMS